MNSYNHIQVIKLTDLFMDQNGFGVSEAVELIEHWLQARYSRPLNTTEKLLISAAWEKRKYEAVAVEAGYNPDSLKQAGPNLWRALGTILGQKVNKTNLRLLVERKKQELTQHPSSEDALQDEPGELDATPFVVLGRRPPMVDHYFGYKGELAMLKQSVVERQCVLIAGQAGIGKSALTSKLLEQLKLSADNPFEKVIWQFMSGNLNLDNLLTEIFDCLGLPLYDSSQDLSVQIGKLIEILQKEKTLIVLDGMEAILQGATKDNPYGQNGNFGWFFKQFMERPHSSCLLMTSREPLIDLTFAESSGKSVRIMNLNGLGQDSYSLLESQSLTDMNDGFSLLINRYRSNPLLLKLVASRIRNYFGGDVAAFIECDSVLMSESLQEALDNQFRSGIWTALEQKIMHLLAHNDGGSEGLPFQQVFKILKKEESNLSIHKLIAAIDTLVSRSLLERSQVDDGALILSLQPVIKKYFLNDPSGVIQESLAA